MTAINEERARLLSQNERQATENDEQSFTSTPYGVDLLHLLLILSDYFELRFTNFYSMIKISDKM